MYNKILQEVLIYNLTKHYTSIQIEQFSERIWAFMRIKKLLEDLKTMVDDSAEKNKTTAEALELSLK